MINEPICCAHCGPGPDGRETLARINCDECSEETPEKPNEQTGCICVLKNGERFHHGHCLALHEQPAIGYVTNPITLTIQRGSWLNFGVSNPDIPQNKTYGELSNWKLQSKEPAPTEEFVQVYFSDQCWNHCLGKDVP